MTDIKGLIAIALSSFEGGAVEAAVPAKHFAFPPYRIEPANARYPDGSHCVMNAGGFNCLTFTDRPGAVWTTKETAQAIADKWNSKEKS